MAREAKDLSRDDIRKLTGRIRLLANSGTKNAKVVDRPNHANREDLRLAADLIEDLSALVFGEQQTLFGRPVQDVHFPD